MKSVFKVRYAVAGALSLVAANAMALAPAAIDSSVVKLYVGGATATDGAVENLFKLNTASGGVCVDGSLDIYYYKSSSGSIQNRTMFCTANFSSAGTVTTNPIVANTTKIAVFKESQGGSANGIVQVARGTPLQFLDFFSASSNVVTVCASITSTPAASGNFSTYNTRDCGAASGVASTVVRTPAVGTPDGVNIIAPVAGVSDVDPGTFVGLGGVVGTDASALTRKRSSVGVTFNPIVSTALYLALQKAQGLVAGTATVPDDSGIDKVPSLSASELRAVMTGNKFDSTSVYSNGVQLSTLAPTADTGLYVCRRGDTSGTMTSFKILFLDQGCAKNGASIGAFVSPDNSQGVNCTTAGCAWTTAYSADFVFAGAGSGDVRSCMDYQSSQGRFAIGTASTESKPNNTTSRWRFVRVDGQLPTLKSVMEGSYDYFTENTFNDKFPATATTGTQAIWDRLATNIGNKLVLDAVNSAWRNAAAIARVDAVAPADTSQNGVADTGILDIPQLSTNQPIFPVTANQVRTNAVNGQSRTYPGNPPNNCNRSYMLTP
jgi:hypothetical protein